MAEYIIYRDVFNKSYSDTKDSDDTRDFNPNSFADRLENKEKLIPCIAEDAEAKFEERGEKVISYIPFTADAFVSKKFTKNNQYKVLKFSEFANTANQYTIESIQILYKAKYFNFNTEKKEPEYGIKQAAFNNATDPYDNFYFGASTYDLMYYFVFDTKIQPKYSAYLDLQTFLDSNKNNNPDYFLFVLRSIDKNDTNLYACIRKNPTDRFYPTFDVTTTGNTSSPVNYCCIHSVQDNTFGTGIGEAIYVSFVYKAPEGVSASRLSNMVLGVTISEKEEKKRSVKPEEAPYTGSVSKGISLSSTNSNDYRIQCTITDNSNTFELDAVPKELFFSREAFEVSGEKGLGTQRGSANIEFEADETILTIKGKCVGTFIGSGDYLCLPTYHDACEAKGQKKDGIGRNDSEYFYIPTPQNNGMPTRARGDDNKYYDLTTTKGNGTDKINVVIFDSTGEKQTGRDIYTELPIADQGSTPGIRKILSFEIKIIADNDIVIKSQANLKELISAFAISATDITTRYFIEVESMYPAVLCRYVDKNSYSGGGKKVSETIKASKVNEFINTWTCELLTEPNIEPTVINVKNYYNVYAGMTPYVKVGFRQQNSNNYVYIDSLYTPYIRDMKIVDNGVKNLELVLFDPNFISFTKGILIKDGGPKAARYSLESLIRAALRANNFYSPVDNSSESKTTRKEGEWYDPEMAQSDLENDYLKFSQAAVSDPTNIKLQFGYADAIAKVERKDNPEWQTSKSGAAVKAGIKFVDKYINLETNDIKHVSEGSSKKADNRTAGGNARRSQINSTNQTVTMSNEMDFMVVGFKTSIRPNGIEYKINAIESKNAKVLTTRFLQRYANISASPEEILYILMHIFNENKKGENIEASNVKILLDKSTSDFGDGKARLVQEFDKSGADDGKVKTIPGDDTYESYYLYGKTDFDATIFKKTNLTFGGESAARNYYQQSVEKPLYKTVAQLMDEFCAACPSKKNFTAEPKKFVDSNGEEVSASVSNETSAPLKWLVVTEKDAKGKPVNYVVLYYRKTRKVGKIRRYVYGPFNPEVSSVSDVSIENANEFALLSAIEYAVDGAVDVKSDSAIYKASGVPEDETKGISGVVARNRTEAKKYSDAYSNSLYKGTINILGDPFYSFDEEMQPFSYPIQLDILIPCNDYEKRLGIKEQSRGVVGSNYKHEMSGFYVVGKITHSISNGRFSTQLELMNYPNIDKDVL